MECIFFSSINDLSYSRKDKVVWKSEYGFKNMKSEKGKKSRIMMGEFGCKCYCVNKGEAGSM